MRKALAIMVLFMVGTIASQATIVDLTVTGSSGTVNGGLFRQISPGSVGTGVLDPFLRIQGNGVEKGFNTDHSAVPGETKPGLWTHSIMASDVARVEIDGSLYRRFMLDINQTQSGPILSLDQIEVYLVAGTTPGANTINTYSGLTAAGSKIWALDTPSSNNYVKLNASLNPGSGWGDMFFYIPDNLFTDDSAFLYLYTIFGETYAANDGFEEWAVLQSVAPAPSVIPEPASLVLCGLGLGLAGLIRRRPR